MLRAYLCIAILEKTEEWKFDSACTPIMQRDVPVDGMIAGDHTELVTTP